MNDTINHFSDPWTTTRKCSFRFAFIFILTFVIVNNNGTFPMFTTITKPLTGMLYSFVPWFSQHILQYHYDYKIVTNGSGDTSYNWVLLFIIFVASFFGTIVWSFLDRKRKSYNACYYWLTVCIRYYVGFMLINYGAIKLAHAQMLPPTLHRLMEPLGEFSPMGLAWTFFGFSKEYNIFIGIIEILSAFLLFRKTMVLGALITIATSLNIMAVNYFFDVPVKLVSTALFLLALYLLLPYLSSLYSLFIKGEKAQLATIERPVYKKTWKNRLRQIAKIGILGFFLVTQLIALADRNKLIKQYFKVSPLYGIYRIDHRLSDMESIPGNWRSIIFEFEQIATIRDNDYLPIRQQIALDTTKHTISINNFTFDYQVEENGDISLRKTWENEIEEIKLIKIDPETFELRKQGFRWIQEYPNNR